MKIKGRTALPCSLLILALICATAASAQDKTKPQDNTPEYRNPGLSIDDRVANLLPRMTLEEKIQQIAGGWEGQVEVIDTTGTFTTQQAHETLLG